MQTDLLPLVPHQSLSNTFNLLDQILHQMSLHHQIPQACLHMESLGITVQSVKCHAEAQAGRACLAKRQPLMAFFLLVI